MTQTAAKWCSVILLLDLRPLASTSILKKKEEKPEGEARETTSLAPTKVKKSAFNALWFTLGITFCLYFLAG